MRLAFAIAVMTTGCDLVFPLRDPPTGNAAANLVFVTSKTFGGNLGGLGGADELCNDAATDAGLGGEYVAWLSDANTDAIDRLSGSRGWVRVDGLPVADLPADLAFRGPLVPILLTESGDDVRTVSVKAWSGSQQDGTASLATCGDWTSGDAAGLGANGFSTSGVRQFIAADNASCGDSLRLYCFGIGKDAMVTIEPRTDPVMFTSAALWSPDSGLEAADTICASEATFPGTFKAAIAPSGDTIVSRFSQRHDYMRPDGLRIGPVLTNPTLDTFPNLTAGKLVVGAEGTWTGGVPGTVSDNASTCGDWVSRALTGTVGDPNSVVRAFEFVMTQLCDEAKHVYCLQD